MENEMEEDKLLNFYRDRCYFLLSDILGWTPEQVTFLYELSNKANKYLGIRMTKISDKMREYEWRTSDYESLVFVLLGEIVTGILVSTSNYARQELEFKDINKINKLLEEIEDSFNPSIDITETEVKVTFGNIIDELDEFSYIELFDDLKKKISEDSPQK